MSRRPLLQIDNLTLRFDTGGQTVHALNGLSYELYPGETLGIVGESGCGKSAQALSIMRLLPPNAGITTGSICFDGCDLLALPERRMNAIRGQEIALIFQDPARSLNPIQPIGAQIIEAIRVHQPVRVRDARQQTLDLLKAVGIPSPEKAIRTYPHELSGGMRQRVLMAIALANHPRLLIADEPTTALDVTIQAQVVKLVRRLRDRFKMSMIWITHDLALIAGLADRVIVMYAGMVVEDAPVGALYEHPRHPYTLALLQSIPRLGGARESLVAIPGRPPDLLAPPVGCPYRPRCLCAVDACVENPPLEPVGDGHRVACWSVHCVT